LEWPIAFAWIRSDEDGGQKPMTSARRLAANRANARKSTGPRTAAGKTRSRANAQRHGFASVVLKWPFVPGQVAALAQALAPASKALQFCHNVILVAEIEPLLQKVRTERFAILQRIVAPAAAQSLGPQQPRNIERERRAIDRALGKLEHLERYLHRLDVRRNRNLRELIEAHADGQPCGLADLRQDEGGRAT
jgi:hypothetical protein